VRRRGRAQRRDARAGAAAAPQLWQVRQDVARVLERAQSELARAGAAAPRAGGRGGTDAPGAACAAGWGAAEPANGHAAHFGAVPVPGGAAMGARRPTPAGAENSRGAGNAAGPNLDSEASMSGSGGGSPPKSTSRRVAMRRKKAAAAAAAAGGAGGAGRSHAASGPANDGASWPPHSWAAGERPARAGSGSGLGSGLAMPGGPAESAPPAAPEPPGLVPRAGGRAGAGPPGSRAGPPGEPAAAAQPAAGAQPAARGDVRAAADAHMADAPGAGAGGHGGASAEGEAPAARGEAERARGTALYKAGDWQVRRVGDGRPLPAPSDARTPCRCRGRVGWSVDARLVLARLHAWACQPMHLLRSLERRVRL